MVSLATQYGLVLSNAAALAPLMYAWRRNRLPEMALLIAVLVASTMFHTCQVGWTCFGLPLQALQIADHFFVYTAIAWFWLYALSIPLRARITVAFAAQAFMAPLIVAFLHDEWVGAAIVAFAVVLTLIVFAIVVHARGMPHLTVASLVISVVIVAIGMVLHVLGGDFGESNGANYPLFHVVWHVLAFISLVFILDIPYPDSFVVATWARIRFRARLLQSGKKPGDGVVKGRRRRRGAGAPKKNKKLERSGSEHETVLSIAVTGVPYDLDYC
jgi:predicted membrane channel-forming protein YqfA (hemolysin III family)